MTDAPYLGEAALMFQFGSQPLVTPLRYHAGPLPAVVFVCLGLYLIGGILGLWMAYGIIRPRRKMEGGVGGKRDPRHRT